MSTAVSEVLAASIFRVVEEGPKSLNNTLSQETRILIDTAGILSHNAAFFSS
jgi:hypothetical protein